MDKVKKNSKGGVLITPEEIQMAFQLLDIEKSGQISLQNMKKRLGVLFPEMSIKDYRYVADRNPCKRCHP
jgi:Ca2+-binding EF-hand superfamily protein